MIAPVLAASPGPGARLAGLPTGQITALQRLVGNAALGQLLRSRPERSAPRRSDPTAALRQAGSPPDPATGFDSAATPSHAVVQRQDEGWLAGLKKALNEEQRFRLGSYRLYQAHKGKDFPWSKQKPGNETEAPLALGTFPLPLPVGPVVVEARAGVSAYVSGNANLDVTLQDITVVISNAELIKLGAKAHYLLLPWFPLPAKLAILASLNFKGTAKLVAHASAALEAGANAHVKAVANPAIWPLAGYVKGELGGYGAVRAEADFEGPAQWEFSLGSLKLPPGQSFAARAQAGITPEIGFNAGLSAGMIVGYRPATLERELWSHRVALGARKVMKAGFEGGGFGPLSTAADGPPTVDLEQVLIKGGALVEALFRARDAANDHVDPNPPAEDPGVSAQNIGAIQTHGQKPPSNRTGAKILWTESEHIIPFATGKRLWEVIGLVTPGRGGHEDRGQTTIMIYFEAARFKTADDNPMSDAFEAKVQAADAVNRMNRARVLIDAGHPEAAKPEVRSVLGLMAAGLRAAKEDAINRSNAAIVRESNLKMDGNPLTNAERRGPKGQPEDAIPMPGQIRAAAETQYTDIFTLARKELEAAHLLRE